MEAAFVYPDWSALPEDLMAEVMRNLDILDLLRAGAVCTSWNAAHSEARRVRTPTDAAPCLLYSSGADDPDTVVGSGHGWVVAADEASNLQVFNPLTGAQVDLPPVTGLYHVEGGADDQGRPVYNVYGEYPEPWTPCPYDPKKLRLFLYCRAYLSCSPSAGAACIILLVHRTNGDISFARLGDDQWTHVAESELVERNWGYRSAAYNSNDGLFYLLSGDCSIYTLDLNETSPVLRQIIHREEIRDDPTRYVVLAPWGDILQVCRWIETRDNPGQVPAELAAEVIAPDQELYTEEIELFRVHLDDQELVKISSSELQGHALFLGFNSTLLLSTKDFPAFKPNCAYITDDSSEHICINMYGCREVGIWNFETQTLESLGDVQSVHPLLNWPPPVWKTPSLS
ncbi:hypothetical protein ACP4OV_028567 [Aristida adscensionis]